MIPETENAIVTRISDASKNGVLAYKLKKVDSYGGDFADGLERIVRDFPAVLVVFGGFRKTKQTQTLVTGIASWKILCCANSLRAEKSARQGDAVAPQINPGSYNILVDMIKLLVNQTFGLDISPLTFGGIDAIVNDKAGQQLASIYGLTLEGELTIDILPNVGSIDDFKTMNVNWDIKTFGNVGPDIPDDENADATDKIILEN